MVEKVIRPESAFDGLSMMSARIGAIGMDVVFIGGRMPSVNPRNHHARPDQSRITKCHSTKFLQIPSSGSLVSCYSEYLSSTSLYLDFKVRNIHTSPCFCLNSLYILSNAKTSLTMPKRTFSCQNKWNSSKSRSVVIKCQGYLPYRS